MEEAQEVVRATSKANLQEELADLLEVIHAICLAHELPYEAVGATRHNIRRRQKKVVLKHIFIVNLLK
nr:hypothetical protein [Candidatus Amoebophilus asiaticus]